MNRNFVVISEYIMKFRSWFV